MEWYYCALSIDLRYRPIALRYRPIVHLRINQSIAQQSVERARSKFLPS